MATNLLDCSSSAGCAPPTLCTSIRPVRERERKERSKTKEWKEGGIHNSSLQTLMCGTNWPVIPAEVLKVVDSNCLLLVTRTSLWWASVSSSCSRAAWGEGEGRGAREKRDHWKEMKRDLTVVPVMRTKKLGFDQTWMASLQICTAN